MGVSEHGICHVSNLYNRQGDLRSYSVFDESVVASMTAP
jgi:hypothetical protein